MAFPACHTYMLPLLFAISIIPMVAGRGLEEMPKFKGVNLGGWLVIEGWMTPSLFDGIRDNDLLDGTKVQFQSLMLKTFISAESGGGQGVVVNRDNPSAWETFRLWRTSDGKFQFRVNNGQFIVAENSGGGRVSANTVVPKEWETFSIVRNTDDKNKVHIKAWNGMYLQATTKDQLTADYKGEPDWSSNAATFQMTILQGKLQGDYQLANGYGHEKATEIYEKHRSEYITEADFEYLAQQGINAVRIPVGWWIKSDPNPPAPFIGGSLEALNSAFEWSRRHNLKVIIDLHAAPGSQNGQDHSASRDGSSDWANSSDYISQSLDVIDFLASRYGNDPALLGIELLNEPFNANVPFDVLKKYYQDGYQTVRSHNSETYVILCQRIGADPHELLQIDGLSSKGVFDVHYYNLFSDIFNNTDAQYNIDYIKNKRQPELQSLNQANGPLVFVGEWTNEWDVKDASLEDYRNFGTAQLEAYEKASFGWSFWNFRNDPSKHWDLKWNIENGILNIRS